MLVVTLCGGCDGPDPELDTTSGPVSDPVHTGAGNGNTGIAPHFTQDVGNVVGLRYHFRVHTNDSPGLKIIFNAHRFWNPYGRASYLLESNLYSARRIYADRQCTTFPEVGSYEQTSALWMGVPDYVGQGKIGLKTLDPAMFPRQTILIDNIQNLPKLEAISQANLDGTEGTIEYFRGGLVTDRSGWKTCGDGALDGSIYQIWTSVVTLSGQSYRLDFALPYDSASYLDPREIVSIYTEFLAYAGLFRAYYWGFEIQYEHGAWEPLTQWKLLSFDGPSTNYGYGFKIAEYAGRAVIEVSNDGTDTYFKQVGTVFTLPVQAEPAPSCTVGVTPSRATVDDLFSWQISSTHATTCTYRIDGEASAHSIACNTSGSANGFAGPGAHTAIVTATGPGGSATCSASWTVDPSPSPVGETYRASVDFGPTQGLRGWSYLDSSGRPMGWDAVNGRWQGSEQFVLLGAGWSHPGVNADSVLRWTAPRGGAARVTGTARDHDTACGNGVVVSIRKGTSELWRGRIVNGDTVGVIFDLTTVLATGESIDFVTNKGRRNNSCDTTGFDPTILIQ